MIESFRRMFRKSESTTVSIAFYLGLIFIIFYHLNSFSVSGALKVADSFRYIWNIELSIYFLRASSLTVRSMNFLLQNDLDRIVIAQLVTGMFSIAIIYQFLKTESRRFNLSLAALLLVVFFSAGSIKYHNIISSESLYASLLIIFTVVLFAYHGKARPVFLVVAGSLFIYSRNPAPYIVIVQLIIYLFYSLPGLPAKKVLAAMAVLFGVSLSALWLIKCCDTTKEINVADNIFSHVFPYPEKVDFFKKKYKMPDGPFVEICQRSGTNVNSPCLNHNTFYTGDSYTRQYRLTNDEYGLADWIRKDGMHAWVDFILFRDTVHTLENYLNALPILSRNIYSIDKSSSYFDIFPELTRLYSVLGALNFFGLTAYLVLGSIIYFFAGRDRGLLLGLALILSALPALFIGINGDSEEINRYTYPVFLTLYIGLLIYFFSLLSMILASLLRCFRSGSRGGSVSSG